MDQRRSAGFVEVLVVIAGMLSLAAYSAFHSLPQAEKPLFSSTTTPTATTTPKPTVNPESFDAIEARGKKLTDNFQLEITINGEDTRISLLGIEQAASDSACMDAVDMGSLSQRLHGARIFLIEQTTTFKDNPQAYYAFLEDLTFLNTELITSGIVKSQATPHTYRNEFLQAEQTARDTQVGMWAARCQPTPTSEPIPLTMVSPTATPRPTTPLTLTPSPTRTPSPSRTPTPTRILPTPETKGMKASIQGESTQQVSATASAISLQNYIPIISAAPTPGRSNNSDLILHMINIHRKTKNLPPFEKHPELCKLAESRAPELNNEIFGSSWIHAGFYSRNIPYWMTENMASYPTEEAVVQWWLGSTVHRAAIEGDYQYSCGACSGNSCSQLFTNFSPK